MELAKCCFRLVVSRVRSQEGTAATSLEEMLEMHNSEPRCTESEILKMKSPNLSFKKPSSNSDT